MVALSVTVIFMLISSPTFTFAALTVESKLSALITNFGVTAGGGFIHAANQRLRGVRHLRKGAAAHINADMVSGSRSPGGGPVLFITGCQPYRPAEGGGQIAARNF